MQIDGSSMKDCRKSYVFPVLILPITNMLGVQQEKLHQILTSRVNFSWVFNIVLVTTLNMIEF